MSIADSDLPKRRSGRPQINPGTLGVIPADYAPRGTHGRGSKTRCYVLTDEGWQQAGYRLVGGQWTKEPRP